MRSNSDRYGPEPTRAEVEATTGPALLEFGANWCGICRGLAPQADKILEEFPGVIHLKVEDGPGKPLGRSFQIKLWPTFVFLLDGSVVGKAVRPAARDLIAGLASITARKADDADQSESP